MNASNWRVDVRADDTSKWYSNGVLFASQLAAKTYALDLSTRWASVRQYRVVEVPVPQPEQEAE